MCPTTIRSPLATLHNFFCDWPNRGHWGEHLSDLHHHPDPPVSDHPNIQAALDIVQRLQGVSSIAGEDGRRYYRSIDVAQAIGDLPLAYKHLAIVDALSRQHFADRRHATGEANLLSSTRGSGVLPWVEPYEYDWWVRTDEPTRWDKLYTTWRKSLDGKRPPDLVHFQCHTRFWLCEHYRQVIAKDPTFFGEVYCPGCKAIRPASEFTWS